MRATFIIIFMGLISPAFSQNGTISGKVLNQLHEPLAGATIIIDSANRHIGAAVSDSSGFFFLNTLAPGRYNIVVSLVGYLTQKLPVDVSTSNSKDTLLVVLQPEAKSMQNVTIIGRKNLFEMKADKIVMNVEQNVLAAGNSVFDLVRMAPGVVIGRDDIIQLKGLAAKIFINDKPAHLSGAQLTEYLKNLPAEALSSIEIISNPSSKYDAEGMAGIINLKMKKKSLMGFNGVAGIGFGFWKYPKANTNLSLNYRTKKLNVFGSVYPGYSESYNQLNYNSIINNQTKTIYQDRDNYWHPKSFWMSYTAGVDYDISKKSVVGFLLTGNLYNSREVTDNTTVFSDGNRSPFEYIISNKSNKISTGNIGYNLNYKTDIDTLGSKFSMDIDYAAYNRKQADINENNYLGMNNDPLRPIYTFRNTQPASTNLISVKFDYTKYFTKKTYIEAGIKYSNVKNDNNLIADSLSNDQWSPDNSRTNHFIYDEKLAAVYLSVNHKFNKTSLQVGLRGENISGKGVSITLGQVNKQNYFKLFPTLFISQKLNSDNTINFSYAHRISRPSYQSLNPFVTYIDPYTLSEGNPFLRPSFTHSFEIKHGFKQVLFTTLSYRHINGGRINVIYQDPNKLITRNKTENSGTDDYIGLNISSSVPVTKWWSTDNNIELAYNSGKSDLPGFTYRTDTYAGSISTNNIFSLKNNFKIQTYFFYNSPNRLNLQRVLSSYGLNIGFQKLLVDKRLTAKLNFNNIIGTTAYRAHYYGEGLDIRWRNEWEGRRINLTLSYKFGNQKIKAARNRNTNSEEKNRVNL